MLRASGCGGGDLDAVAERLDLLRKPTGVCLWAAFHEPVGSEILIGDTVREDVGALRVSSARRPYSPSRSRCVR